jgi:peptide/nickel transport system permease protein
MLTYAFKRILFTIPILIGITAITYFTICLAPGGPAAGLVQDFNPKVSPEFKEKQIRHFNFDKPIHVQYLLWLKNIAKLDFGVSWRDNEPVIRKISERLPKTLLLTGLSLAGKNKVTPTAQP